MAIGVGNHSYYLPSFSPGFSLPVKAHIFAASMSSLSSHTSSSHATPLTVSTASGVMSTDSVSSIDVLKELIPTSADQSEALEYPITAPQLPARVRSSNLDRSQLFQRFYDLHLGASTTARRIFAYETLGYGQQGKPVTTVALDALCVAQIGTSFKDLDLQRDAKLLYNKALQHVRLKVDQISPAQPDIDMLDDIIGGLQALTACAWFNCLELPPLEWMRHPQAVLKVIELFGWESLKRSTINTFYYNWKYRAFFNALAENIQVSWKEPPSDLQLADPSESFLTEYAYSVPGLLWRAQRFVQASDSGDVSQYMVMRMLTELGVLVAKLKRWHVEWIKKFPRTPHYSTVGTKTFKSFKSLCGQHIEVFPLAYVFSHPRNERDFRIFCFCLVQLDQAILDINNAFEEHCNVPQLRVQLREAKSDANTAATDLCMLVPQSAVPEHNAFAAIHSFLPLHYASVYFEKQGGVRQLMWCRQVTASLKDKYGVMVAYPTPN